MFRRFFFLAGKMRSLLCATLLLALGALGLGGTALADSPEYWTRETFKTERTTIATSFQPFEAEAARSTRQSRPARFARSTSARAEIAETPSKPKAKPVRVASLGKTYVPEAKPQKSVAGGGGIRWLASASCLDGGLRGVLAQVASRFGSVTVNSTCRSPSHNRRVGGASKSWHLSGDAADFRVHGNWGAASSFLRGVVGGFKHYGGGLFHIDTGPKRTW